jgi:PAS domain S-box-containing protein
MPSHGYWYLQGMTSETHGTKRSSEPLDLRTLIETIPALVVCALADGSAEFANRAWYEYTGCSSPELTGWGWHAAIHPDDLPQFIQEWTVATAAGKPFETEARVRRADGEYQWFAIKKALAVSRDQVGEPSLRALITCEDIDERKQAQDRLQQNEQRWQTAFENSAIGIIIRDWADRFLATNSAFRNMLGYTELELCQLRSIDVTYEEDRALNLELIGELREGKRQHFEIEKRYRRKDGTLVWVRNNVALVPGTGGVAPFLFTVVEDITQRKKEESARRYIEQRYRVMVETASDAVVCMDENGAILLANPATARVFGYEHSELIGRPLTVLMPEFLRKMHEDGFRRYKATGQRHLNWPGTELTGLRKNGQEFPVEVSFGEVAGDGHRIFTGFVRDISERKQAEELRASLHTTQVELARVSRLTIMGELAASIAHEVNQPLTAVTNNANACLRLLARHNLEPEVLRRALEEIVADGTRASSVIARIRAFIKKAPTEMSELDINEVIQEVLALARRELSDNRVLLEPQLTKALPPVLADRVQLQQVLLNLIMNGIEAMTAVTDRPRLLWVQSRIDESGDLLVVVRDSGAGLGSEADRVFTPFFTTKAHGMGMGLPISRSLIEGHGGRLWATPNSPHGAVFSFTLPVPAGSPS